ncbi:hypothetical protein NBRC116493_04010 [Aurantivibrio infirmus]
MSFKNEMLSGEDQARYKTKEILDKYLPYDPIKTDATMFPRLWVIDRERDVFLLFVTHVTDSGGRSGLAEPTGEIIWLLSIKGRNFEVRLKLGASSSKRRSKSSYLIVWQLISLEPKNNEEITYDDAILLLKEALQVYGKAGAVRQIPNTVVKFEF